MAALRRSGCNSAERQSWRVPLVLSAPLAGVSGVACLFLDACPGPSARCRAAGGLLLLLAAGIQSFIWWHTVRGQTGLKGLSVAKPKRMFLSLVAGWLGCYVVALVIGPQAGIAWLLYGLFTLWASALFACNAAALRFPNRLTSTLDSRGAIAMGRCLTLVLLIVVGGEMWLRCFSVLMGDPLSGRYVVRQLKPQPGTVVFGRSVNSQGFLGNELPRVRPPGVFRIAVVGDEVALSGCQTGWSTFGLESHQEGIEVYNFALPNAGPREYLALVQSDVANYRPDLVLCFVSVGSDITRQIPLPGWFDWRGLRVYQLLDRKLAVEPGGGLAFAAMSGDASVAGGGEFLRAAGLHMSVCRSPMAAPVRRQWQQSLGQLTAMAQRCRRDGRAMGMVVVPSEFQVNQVLCTTLLRRTGSKAESLDMGLPQRRLSAFAQQIELPLLDLMPHLQLLGASAFRHQEQQLSERGVRAASDAVSDWLGRSFRDQIAAVTRGQQLTAASMPGDALRRERFATRLVHAGQGRK